MEDKTLVPGVVAGSDSRVEGVWVGKEGRSIGLVDEGAPLSKSYLAIYASTTQPLPLAICHDGVQLPRKSQSDPVRFIKWEDLYKLVQANITPDAV